MSLFFEEKAHPLLLSQACRARLGMTTRVREGSITIDHYDSQSLEVARQVGTTLFTIGITIVCNLLFWKILSSILVLSLLLSMLLEVQANLVLLSVSPS